MHTYDVGPIRMKPVIVLLIPILFSFFILASCSAASQPQITSVARVPVNPPPSFTVNVTCQILDKYGLTNVSLHFSIDNATETTTKMQIVDGDFFNGTFRAEIPSEPLNTYVEYHVSATDSIGYSTESLNQGYRVSYDNTPPTIVAVTRIKPSGDPVLSTESVEIEAVIVDEGSGVKNATLWFGETQDPYEANFNAVPMNRASGDDWNCTFVGTIPPYQNGSRILYFVSATDNSNNTAPQNQHTPYYVSEAPSSRLTIVIEVFNVDMNSLTATLNITFDALLPSLNEPDSLPINIENKFDDTLADSPLYFYVNSSSQRYSYKGTVTWNVHLVGLSNRYPFDSYYLNLTYNVDWSEPDSINFGGAWFGDFRLRNLWGDAPGSQSYNMTDEYERPVIVTTLTFTRASANVLPLTLLIQVLFFVLGGTMLVDPTEMLNERITVFLAILVFSAGFFFSLNSVVPYRLGFTVGELLILSVVVGSGAFTLVSFLSRALKSLLRGHQQIIGMVMDGIAALLLTWWLSEIFSEVPMGYWILLVVALWYGLTIRVAIGGLRWVSTRHPVYDPRLYE